MTPRGQAYILRDLMAFLDGDFILRGLRRGLIVLTGDRVGLHERGKRMHVSCRCRYRFAAAIM